MALGEMSRDVLQRLGYALEWKQYPMGHQVSMPEIADISAWIQKRLATAS
jgi:phospholipase/carboxylesterase